MKYPPQGYERVGQWRQVVEQPLVAIGGVDLERAQGCVRQGADSICVVSAVTKASDLPAAVGAWQRVFKQQPSSSSSSQATIQVGGQLPHTASPPPRRRGRLPRPGHHVSH